MNPTLARKIYEMFQPDISLISFPLQHSVKDLLSNQNCSYNNWLVSAIHREVSGLSDVLIPLAAYRKTRKKYE